MAGGAPRREVGHDDLLQGSAVAKGTHVCHGRGDVDLLQRRAAVEGTNVRHALLQGDSLQFLAVPKINLLDGRWEVDGFEVRAAAEADILRALVQRHGG